MTAQRFSTPTPRGTEQSPDKQVESYRVALNSADHVRDFARGVAQDPVQHPQRVSDTMSSLTHHPHLTNPAPPHLDASTVANHAENLFAAHLLVPNVAFKRNTNPCYRAVRVSRL